MTDQHKHGYLVGGEVHRAFIKPQHDKPWTAVQYAAVEVDDYEHVTDEDQQPGKKTLAVCEGCIILGTHADMKATADHLLANPSQLETNEVMGSAIIGDRYRWKNGKIPFRIHPALRDQYRVYDAIKHWHEMTPIRLEPHSAGSDYVEFVPGSGCASAVGRQGGRQEIIVGPGCTTGNLIHEIGHTVGLWHEQSRIDRDAWVEILWSNMDPRYSHNFEQHITDGIDLNYYDYGSIMHYPSNAFSRNGQPTIRPRRNGPEMGQRSGLSVGDIAAVRAICSRI
ncbi:hypothetical protein N825_22895 [Skermanella stibiiresistens SB22]|uniref:Peptidase M12A domain-containing protein n=1 Tax=Skermanella stibiiresistens SB22 TaxID=1385369 RepID=W9GZQ0_9PROT|nr:M12 family metallopeptidase [Skermanella stibiiresistens]EWY36963.1 hypothetical protein N825_22895 [Skermanella stibiiresistens SB22]